MAHGCRTGKVQFPNVRAARTALHSCRHRGKRNVKRRERSFYRCEFCHEFHLTSELPDDFNRFA